MNAIRTDKSPLTVPSGNPDSSAIYHRVQEPAQPSNHVPGPCVGDEDVLNLKSNTTSEAKSSLLGVKESARGFPPLKFVAGGLCLVLDSCEVRFPSNTFNLYCSQLLQQTEVNREAIELLAPRIKILSESLCAPIPLGDVNEKEREEDREAKLKQ